MTLLKAQYDDFVFYGSYCDSFEYLSTDERNLLLHAIVEYGTGGTFEKSTPVVNAIMANISKNIDSSKERYRKSIINGTLGGRPQKVDHFEIAKAFYLDKKTKNILCVDNNVSVSTVERAISKYEDYFKNVVTKPEKEETGKQP